MEFGERSPEERAVRAEPPVEARNRAEVLSDFRQAFIKELTQDEDYEEKVAIITALPDIFIEEMHAHLMNTDIERKKYNERPIGNRDEALMVLRGELFERLAQVELTRRAIAEGKSKSEEEQRVAEEAVALFHNPRRFNIFKGGRNPDIAVIDIETQTIVGVVEAKTGFLNERAAQQMENFEYSMRNILALAKRMRREKGSWRFKDKHGLSEETARLQVADNLERSFIVPKGRGASSGELLGEYVGAFENDGIRQDLAERIDRGEIGILHSIFSNEEIGRITNKVMVGIEARIGKK